MKISIITVNFNNREGLESTIKSVISQKPELYEYIIIDGGSTDGSVDVIKKYSYRIHYWCSEKDKGIYHAMNKGIAVATGDYCNFLNSGDTYHDSLVLSRLAQSNKMGGVIIGNVININEKTGRKTQWASPLNMTMKSLYISTPNHQASFFPTEIIKQRGYNLKYKMLGDFDLFMFCFIQKNVSYHKLDFLVVDYQLGGFSASNESLYTKERNEILHEYLPDRIIDDYETLLHPKDRFGIRALYLEKYNRGMLKIAGVILEALALPVRLQNFIKAKYL